MSGPGFTAGLLTVLGLFILTIAALVWFGR